MSSTESGSGPATPGGTSPRPTLWIVLVVILALAAIGLGIWAFTLRSELESAQGEVAREATELAQEGEKQRQTEGTLRKAQKRFEAVHGKLGVTSKDLKKSERQVRKLSRQKSSAKKNAAKSKRGAQAETTRAEQAEACLGGVLAVFKGVLDASRPKVALRRAPAKLRGLGPSCQAIISGGK